MNVQEIGATRHPYESNAIFSADHSIQSLDSCGLFTYYQMLTRLRKEEPALIAGGFEEILIVNNESCFAYLRRNGDRGIFVALNMGTATTRISLVQPFAPKNPSPQKRYCLTDAVIGIADSSATFSHDTLTIVIPGYTTRIFAMVLR